MTTPSGPMAQAALDAVRAAASATPADFALAPPAPQEPTVTDRTPQETLTAAAEKLRGLAAAAGGQQWAADHYPEGAVVHPVNSTHSPFQLHADGLRPSGTPCVSPAVGAYIAALHPTVAAALADWLETAAANAAVLTWPNQFIEHALAVAREILGEAS